MFKASPNNPLNVEYVELQGITTDTGVPVTKGQQIKRNAAIINYTGL